MFRNSSNSSRDASADAGGGGFQKQTLLISHQLPLPGGDVTHEKTKA
jgi:hypothetical protein